MIILVVDNKSRDLPALTKLAEKINSDYSVPTVLTDIYQVTELISIFKNNITLILFSFMRKENFQAISYAYYNKIKIAIYDQEGANGFDSLGVVQNIKINKKLLRFINAYFFWGEKQLKEAKKLKNLNLPKIMKKTGYIRFETPISKIKKKKILNGKSFFLVNSNFALIDPKYNTRAIEVEAVKDIKLYGSNLKKFLSLMIYRKKNFLKSVEILLKKNPKINFVLRPHPYESENDYMILSRKYSNAYFSTKYNSINWIVNSLGVIHIDCMTAIEALKYNKPSISFSWLIKNKNLCYYVPQQCSYQAKSIDDVNKQIRSLHSRKIKKLTNSNTTAFKNFYGDPKKSAIDELAKCIIETSQSTDKRKFYFTSLSLRIKIKLFLKKYLPYKIFLIIVFFVSGPKTVKKYINKPFKKTNILNFIKNKKNLKKFYRNSFIVSSNRNIYKTFL